jgi:uncharacterized protein (TIGR02300 family)
VAKPELGTKRTCPSCGTRYYDLNRVPIVCPSCATVFELAVPQRAERPPEPKVEKPQETVEVEREAEVVSLEEAEAGPEEDVGPDADSEDDEPVVPGVEVDAEIEEEAADDTFLEADEEEGDDVSGLLDVDAEDEEER